MVQKKSQVFYEGTEVGFTVQDSGFRPQLLGFLSGKEGQGNKM